VKGGNCPSFRLVRNRSLEGFPTRFACGNDMLLSNCDIYKQTLRRHFYEILPPFTEWLHISLFCVVFDNYKLNIKIAINIKR